MDRIQKTTRMRHLLILALVLQQSLGNGLMAQTPQTSQRLGTWGHGSEISDETIHSMPFLHGWNFTFYWKELEPRKGEFNWKLFDDQIMKAINHRLYVGFMVWVGQYGPDWLYDQDSVEKVQFDDPMHKDFQYFPYYLNTHYKTDYLNLLHAVADHVTSLPPAVRSKILFWMSAEGSTGDVTPYKATPLDPKYVISDQQWLAFKTDAWDFMYRFGNSLTPKLHILINQSNNGKYFDFLLQHYPEVWFKTGSLSHAYQFDDELEYYHRLQRVVRADNNGMDNRLRGESEEVQQLGWFKQSPQQNNFALIVSCLHFGMDILNVRKEIIHQVGNNFYPFEFFNKYSGQRDPGTATGAFCMLRDVLDLADTIRFPQDRYDSLAKTVQLAKAKRIHRSENVTEDEAKKRRTADISNARKQKILEEFAPYGARNGTTQEEDKIIYKDDDQLEPKLRKENLRTDLMDKYNNDMGVNLIPGNYFRFLEQYAPNTTSRGYWRVGPVDQVYGRYARGFDHASGMKEMFFALDRHFFNSQEGVHAVKLSITYFDKGNGVWSLNYHNGKIKKEALKVRGSQTGRWVTKTLILKAAFGGHLEHSTDLSLKYVSGDDTLFSLIELERL